MPQISRGRALAYIAVLLVGLTFAGRVAFSSQGGGEQVLPAVVRAEPAPARKLLVHVVGAVRTPGLYRLDEGSRIDDAITAELLSRRGLERPCETLVAWARQ